MNNTKWNAIFKAFYSYECNNVPVIIRWRTKDCKNGFLSKWDNTWTHFGCEQREWDAIEYLQIELTNCNRNIVIEQLKKIHVPGVISDNVITVYGYRQDVDYI